MSTKILIVGAGLAGLSLARQLDKFDLEFEIIERNPSEAISHVGVVLPFTAVRELKQLGVFGNLTRKFYQITEIKSKTMTGGRIGTTDLTAPPFEKELFISLKRQDLWQALFKGYEKKVRFNTELLSVSHGDNHVHIDCSNELLNGNYDLVIAADGLNSTIRSLNYEGQQMLIDHGMLSWRFLLSCPGHDLSPTCIIGNNTDMFSFYPVNADLLHCYAHIHEEAELYNSTESTSRNIARIFSVYGAPVPDLLDRLEGVKIVSRRLKSVSQPCFFDRRIAFVGDAANGCASFMQQGIASTLEDSRCLADSLAMQSFDAALESYRERRHQSIKEKLRHSEDHLAYFCKAPGLSGRLLRYLAIRLFGLPPVRGWKNTALARPLD